MIASDSCGSPSSDGPSPPEGNERRDSLRIGTHRLPASLALVSLAVRSQLPDLVAKPLAYLDVFTYGRSVSASVFAFARRAVWWVATCLRGR